MTTVDLNQRLYAEPFRPFRVHLSDGSSISVMQPGMIIVGEALAVLPVEFGKDEFGRRLVKRHRTITLADIVRFSNVDKRGSGKGKKSE